MTRAPHKAFFRTYIQLYSHSNIVRIPDDLEADVRHVHLDPVLLARERLRYHHNLWLRRLKPFVFSVVYLNEKFMINTYIKLQFVINSL